MLEKINMPVATLAIAVVIIASTFLLTREKPKIISTQTEDVVALVTPAKKIDTKEISRLASDIPPPITRKENATVVIELDAVQLVAEIEEGVTYEYWTFNKMVPGPFVRVKEGDTVEIQLKHSHDHTAYDHHESDFASFFDSFVISSLVPLVSAQEHDHPAGTPMDHGHDTHDDHIMPDGSTMTAEDHILAGHGEHSIDLHAVQGAMGGAEFIRTAPNETKAFAFKALKPGIYIYHCGSPHVATHIANGMYGMILVEPKDGLPKVDKEFYIVQGELYTSGKTGEKGHHAFSLEKLLSETPDYVPFNGRMGALDGDRALKAKVGDKIRIFFGSSGQLVSSFHAIGEIFDYVYREGDLMSQPAKNVQTTLVPAGGAIMTEFTVDVPGTYLLVDHSLGRALNKGAHAQLIVEGEEQPDIIRSLY